MLAARVRACLVDLDGVLIETAQPHAVVWKEMFDGYLKTRADETATTLVALDEVGECGAYVDGKGMADGAGRDTRRRGGADGF